MKINFEYNNIDYYAIGKRKLLFRENIECSYHVTMVMDDENRILTIDQTKGLSSLKKNAITHNVFEIGYSTVLHFKKDLLAIKMTGASYMLRTENCSLVEFDVESNEKIGNEKGYRTIYLTIPFEQEQDFVEFMEQRIALTYN